MAFILTKNNEKTTKYVIEGYIDSKSEIDTLRTDFAAGSKITVIEDGSIYILNLNKEWVLLP